PLGNHAFPALATGPLPGLRVRKPGDQDQRRLEWQAFQDAASLVEGEPCQVAAVPPKDVEHVIRDLTLLAPDARRLAIEDDLPYGQRLDCSRDGRIRPILEEAVSGEETHVPALLECEQANAIELALEDPIGTIEPLLSKRRGHRFDPFGER